MSFYGINTTPIIEELNDLTEAAQVWYADDSSACGTVQEILLWWQTLCQIGPKYGYIPNPKKTVLIVKDESKLQSAKTIFEPLGVNVTNTGERHLGAVVGSENFRTAYVREKVNSWVESVNELATIATKEPQYAYSCYVKGLSHKWTFLQRTIPEVSSLFQPLEEAIRSNLVPALLGKSVSDLERDIIALPTRLGGLGIYDP